MTPHSRNPRAPSRTQGPSLPAGLSGWPQRLATLTLASLLGVLPVPLSLGSPPVGASRPIPRIVQPSSVQDPKGTSDFKKENRPPAQIGASRLPAESVLIGCDKAGQRVQVSTSSHLDPACSYTQGLDIVASDVVLDCRGALITDLTGTLSRGIAITASTEVALTNVTVRNCRINGFTNSVRVTRSGFKALVEGAEYENAYTNIVVEDSQFSLSRGSGVFVDGYVTGVTLRHLELTDAGSVGVYLEAGSKDNVVEDCVIEGNGFGDVDPEGIPITLDGFTVYYVSTGREGIAIDGSRDNIIRDNVISGNAAGGIFLYKNCGEYATEKPTQWWERRYGAEGNLIQGNRISDEETGIWVGSRMAENQYFMDCSDPAYVSFPFVRIHLDYAAQNTLQSNILERVDYGIRLEDDQTWVEDNLFASNDATDLAILVGTLFRTELLDLPVSGSSLVNNQAELPRNSSPYVWIHPHADTAYTNNTLNGVPASLRQGQQPPLDWHLFVDDFWFERQP